MKTPIYDFLKQYAERDGVRLHMPGHKGHGPLGIEALDITEVKGADVLGEATGIIGESEANAASLFNTGKTLYFTGGSTSAIFAMLALARSRFATAERTFILASRNAHRAFLHGVALLDIPVSFMLPKNADAAYSGVMTPSEVDAALTSAPSLPFAVYITSPSYLGEMWDIDGIAEVCKRQGVPLLVDNAHGAYLAFLSPSLHPIAKGALMCTDSAHKTLPVLTGGAYLHIAKGEEWLYEEAKNASSLFSSTSPSYLILASLDLANRTLADGYPSHIAKTAERIKGVKERLTAAGFTVLPSEPFKITLSVKDAPLLAEKARCEGIECEFADPTHLVFMASAENKMSDFEFLEQVLLPLAPKFPAPTPPPRPHLGAPVLSVREALFAPKERVALKDAVGRIYAEISASCPPAVPIAVCGERIEKETVEAFLYYGIDEISVVKNNA